MKRKPNEPVYSNFFETLLQLGHWRDLAFQVPTHSFVSTKGRTIITKRIFESELFQLLLIEGIK